MCVCVCARAIGEVHLRENNQKLFTQSCCDKRASTPAALDSDSQVGEGKLDREEGKAQR